MFTNLIMMAALAVSSQSVDLLVHPELLNIKKPVVIQVTDFDEASAQQFVEQMEVAQLTGQPLVLVNITSFGGSVFSLIRMVDAIKASKIPVATSCQSYCMSAGAVLLAMGKEGMRYAGPNATVLIHSVSSMSTGKIIDMKTSLDAMDRLNNIILGLMSENTGHPKDFFSKMVDEKRTDIWLGIDEAKKLNIINKVGVPVLRIEVKFDYLLE